MRIRYPYELRKCQGRYLLLECGSDDILRSSENKAEVENEYLIRVAIDTHGAAVRDNTRDQLISIGLDIEERNK